MKDYCGEFWESFHKILRKISEDFGKYFEHLRVFWKIFSTKSFRKISKIISENFWKLPELFLEVTRNITEVLRIILKIFNKFSENFDNYCGEFWELFHNIFRNISENSENYCGRFRKSFQNFEDFEKYFGHFREVFRKIISKNSSEIIEKYFRKFWKLYWRISKTIFSKNFEINFWRFREIRRTFSKSISENFELSHS